ncbi:MAG: IS110 family transposase [Bacteroidota bacterium]
MKFNTYGLDIAKNIFHTFTITEDGEILKKKFSRDKLLEYFVQQKPGLIGIEACGSSHHWAREFIKLGHEVILMNPKHVKAYLKGNKNDYNDAEAIFEAVSSPNVRKVGIKTIEQQDIQLIHSLKEELTKRRTAMVNQIRGHLRERGVVIPVGINNFFKQMPEILDNEDEKLSQFSLPLFRQHYETIKQISEDIKQQEKLIVQLCKVDDLSQRFSQIRGVGPMGATIAAADLGKSRVYDNGRQYAASLGLVPRQHTTGDKPYLLGISKRGNKYIRTLLIHGARAVLSRIGEKKDKLSCWLRALIQRRGFNKAAVALANKNARILWALATHGTIYKQA